MTTETPQDDLRLSVVITSYNRAAVLEEMLKRFSAQTADRSLFEVLVMDDGSPDDTRERVERMVDSVPYDLRYLRHENQGIGYTQNAGMKAARHPLVLLMADDIWPAPQLVEEHLRAHRAHPEENIGVLGGVAQCPELPQTALTRAWDPFQYDRFEGRERLEGIYFHACNVSVKREFLLRSGGFRQRRGIAHEDIELGYRLSQQGLQLLYVPEAFAHHHHEESLDGICKRAYERGLNFGLLSDNVPGELIFPLYKIATLQAGLRGFLQTLPREILRWPVFNRWTVEGFWLPILRRAESSRFARLFATGTSYRGVAGHYLRAGYRQLQRQTRSGAAG